MAEDPLIVTLRAVVRDCQPDGRECKMCGDVPYLWAAELCVSINGDEPTHVAYLCKDCGEVARERFD